MRMPKLSARLRILLITYSMTIGLCACGSGSDNLPVDAPVADTYGEPSQSSAVPSSADTNISSADASSPETEAVTDAEPLRDATPVCLVPRADGTATASNDVAVIDYSHMSDGYVCANYTGTCPKVKLRITGPDTVVYTYDLHGGGYETFPLSSGDGYYDVTIYENISYGRPGASKEDVIEAAKRAGAHDFIMELKDGYDTYVGERGVKLSGGQKQRISIARVFLKNPPIIILDEATSALDNESEFAVAKSLGELSEGRTTLTIAHRLSSIRNSDRILVLTDDGIVEEGDHDQLMEQKGIYYQFYETANALK